MMKQLQQTLPLPHRLDSQFLSSGVSELVSSRVTCNLLRFTRFTVESLVGSWIVGSG